MCFPITVNILNFSTQIFLPILKTTSLSMLTIIGKHIFDNIEDAFIWSNNKIGAYSTKSGYTCLLSLTNSQVDDDIQATWSWIWKIKALGKYKFLVWLACHDVAPTFYVLHHRRIDGSAICSRCGD